MYSMWVLTLGVLLLIPTQVQDQGNTTLHSHKAISYLYRNVVYTLASYCAHF